jgi:iron complex outermembrane receptor protein
VVPNPILRHIQPLGDIFDGEERICLWHALNDGGQGHNAVSTGAENAFNLQSVDILSGPSSVLYGQGAVGGTVNVITKRPVFAPVSFDAYSAQGSFSTFEEGFGAGGQISKTFAFRSDFSYYQSHGYVTNADPKNLNGTGSLLYAPTKTLSFLFALDVLKDKLPSYYGTPMVTTAFATSPLNGVITNNLGLALDSRMRYNNYNVRDAELNSSSYQPSLTINWQPTPALTITNQTYYYHAARDWMNAEQYIFIPVGTVDGNGGIAPINEIERDRFQVHHNQQLPGDSFNVAYTHKLFGLSNKFSAGYEFYNISFSRARGFNFANNYADFVDALHPVQGTYAVPYDPGDNAARVAPTKITDNAVFAEDSLKVTSRLNVVAGLHFENFYLDRLNFGPTGRPSLPTTSVAHTIPSTSVSAPSMIFTKGLPPMGNSPRRTRLREVIFSS